MENWAEIHRLHRAEGVPIREVARRLGVARNTVRAALASDRAPRYPRGSISEIGDSRASCAGQFGGAFAVDVPALMKQRHGHVEGRRPTTRCMSRQGRRATRPAAYGC